MLKHARRATIALTTSALLVTGLGGTPASAARSDVSPPAAKASDWLVGQLDGGLASSEYQWDGQWYSYTDYGLSLDFFFAFEELGLRKAKRQQILDAIEPQLDSYVTYDSTTYAGALGKLLSAVQAQGIDPSTYGAGDLLSRLEGLVHTAEDSELGRAEDGGSTDESDTSNTLGQSFAAQALVVGDSALADEAVRFLLKQQCSDGYFRVYMNSADHTCDAGVDGESGASVDATAAAVLALLAIDEHGVAGVRQKRLDNVLRSAGRWLVQDQQKNGSFAEDGIRNSNSTGLAAQALGQLGRGRPAADAASWLKTLRVTGKMAKKTAFTRRDIGAVAFNRAALREGRTDGISRDSRYQWRRATAQAAGGLDS